MRTKLAACRFDVRVTSHTITYALEQLVCHYNSSGIACYVAHTWQLRAKWLTCSLGPRLPLQPPALVSSADCASAQVLIACGLHAVTCRSTICRVALRVSTMLCSLVQMGYAGDGRCAGDTICLCPRYDCMSHHVWPTSDGVFCTHATVSKTHSPVDTAVMLTRLAATHLLPTKV